MKKYGKYIGLYIPAELYDRLKASAAREGRSMSNVVRRLLAWHYEPHPGTLPSAAGKGQGLEKDKP